MKIKFTAAIAALATLTAASAFAQAPAGRLTVDKTTLGQLWAIPAAQAVLKKDVPELEMFIEQIKDQTLVQVAPMSQGAIDDAKLKQIQADLDKIGK